MHSVKQPEEYHSIETLVFLSRNSEASESSSVPSLYSYLLEHSSFTRAQQGLVGSYAVLMSIHIVPVHVLYMRRSHCVCSLSSR